MLCNQTSCNTIVSALNYKLDALTLVEYVSIKNTDYLHKELTEKRVNNFFFQKIATQLL